VAPAVLDTDVASLGFKQRLPATLVAQLAGHEPCITFITLAELTKWAEVRRWGARRRERLLRWLDGFAVLRGTEAVARRWGELSAAAEGRGRPRPIHDTWIASCCLTYELPLATLNIKDFTDFADHEGLVLLGRADDYDQPNS
jgi:predicted nucleic acid-binding protein